MKIIYSLVLVLSTLPLITFGQMEERIIDFPPKTMGGLIQGEDGKMIPTKDEAIEIVEIKIGNEVVELGKSFSADGDWLSDLTFKVKNISGRPISAIRIGFALPETKYKKSRMGFSLEYGRTLSTGIDYGDQKAILPKEEVTLFRNEAHYERDRKGIEMRTGKVNFTKVFITVTVVKFEDETTFMTWKLPIAKKEN